MLDDVFRGVYGLFLLTLGAAQTPVADWPSAGLNLCNSRADISAYRFYARKSGPLFGALASVQ